MTDDVVVGIDLGTTNSAVAWVTPEGRAEVIPNAEGGKVTPSVVQYATDGSVVVGETARQQLALEEGNTGKFFKLEMGTQTEYLLAGRRRSPVELSAAILRQLRADAESALGRPVRRAVITVPAYFLNAARDATRQAGELAGLEVLQLINEPTAAAFAYGGGRRETPETLMVYDLGGGTFDISVVRSDADAVEVVATDGNHQLGGKDWDDRLVEYLAERYRERHDTDPLGDPQSYHELRLRAEDAKRSLSRLTKAAVTVSCGGTMERIEVDRATFETLTLDLLAQTEMLMSAVLTASGLGRESFDGILMVGGSTRMPMCEALVTRFLGRSPRTAVHPDESVALGAALLAHQLVAGPQSASSSGAGARLSSRRIRDVMSHSLGMIAVSAERDRYVNSVLIPRNRPVPCSEVRPFEVGTRSGRDNTTAVYVTQGESESPADCTFVGKYEIGGIPHGERGKSVIEIAYAYDASGVVQVTARVAGSGAALTVTPHPVPQDMAWVHRAPRTVEDLRIAVSEPHYDDIGAILRAMRVAFQPLRKVDESLDLVFVNCGATAPDARAIEAFVSRGGVLYASDHVGPWLEKVFPGKFRCTLSGAPGTAQASVVNTDLRGVLGPTLTVKFDMATWAQIQERDPDTEVCLSACGSGVAPAGMPLMINFRHGEGSVFFTAFHNGAQLGEHEQNLLRAVVLKQLSAAAGVPFEMLAQREGYLLPGRK
ncbi:MAG: Hsp70 family protein [Candidatus Eisenbacteria bacterium]|uniref:Hsp70 family protein n=1 Tax=Eiseniibacteriota bacterium TaxID=2212470 RepID=A0A933SCF9_UNCEI|nr:Hsp70 family protein [Candidatus Eisenbacteria bacterium]